MFYRNVKFKFYRWCEWGLRRVSALFQTHSSLYSSIIPIIFFRCSGRFTVVISSPLYSRGFSVRLIGHLQAVSTLCVPVPPVWCHSESYCLFTGSSPVGSWSPSPLFSLGVTKQCLPVLMFSQCVTNPSPFLLSNLLFHGLSWCVSLHNIICITNDVGPPSAQDGTQASICKSLDPVGNVFCYSPGFGTVQQDSFHNSLNNFSLVFRLICFDFQTGLRRRKAVLVSQSFFLHLVLVISGNIVRT